MIGATPMRRSLQIAFAVLVWVVAGACLPASAFDIQDVKSPRGIKAYLVESHAIPLISMEFAFDGGSALDPEGKEGTAQFLTGLMDEGADDLTGEQFRRARDSMSIRLSFDVGADRFYGSLTTLSKNAPQAFELLRKAISRPRFESEAIERMRVFYLQSAEQAERDQNSIAGRQWMELAFPNHSYSRQLSGTARSLKAITREDIAKFHATAFSRNGLKVAVTGDIDANHLADVLDQTFGALPDVPVPHPTPVTQVHDGPTFKLINYDAPQTMFVFGGKGTRDQDPDDFANFILCEILGGEASFALLGTELREKRGLTYGISFSAQGLDYAGFDVGGFSTANANGGTALKLVKETLRDMAARGPTEQQLKLAKSYLTGAYALRFDSNRAIANHLLSLQVRGLPKDYSNTRNARVNAVTREQVAAAARRYLAEDKLIVVAVGKPEGLPPPGQ